MKFNVKIGTAQYCVRAVPHLLRDMNAYGRTAFSSKQIQVDEDLIQKQPDLFVQTLAHELFHAALHEYGVVIEDAADEEHIVDSLAMCLTLLRQNKTFMKIFVQGPK